MLICVAAILKCSNCLLWWFLTDFEVSVVVFFWGGVVFVPGELLISCAHTHPAVQTLWAWPPRDLN